MSRRVFIDLVTAGDQKQLQQGGKPIGRIIIELATRTCPKTTENFIKLCTGECGNSQKSGKPLHYKDSPIHRIETGFVLQG
jgi:cyclophilin family peptidyl-prolyl cis-trans isomerase